MVGSSSGPSHTIPPATTLRPHLLQSLEFYSYPPVFHKCKNWHNRPRRLVVQDIWFSSRKSRVQIPPGSQNNPIIRDIIVLTNQGVACTIPCRSCPNHTAAGGNFFPRTHEQSAFAYYPNWTGPTQVRAG